MEEIGNSLNFFKVILCNIYMKNDKNNDFSCIFFTIKRVEQ